MIEEQGPGTVFQVYGINHNPHRFRKRGRRAEYSRIADDGLTDAVRHSGELKIWGLGLLLRRES
jgi:hypothetical protein